MQMILRDPMVLFVIGVMVLIIIIAISYKVSQFMKGSLQLEVNQKKINSGETVTGVVTLNTKKKLFADQFYIALVGERQETTHTINGTGGRGTSSKWIEFYRKQQDFLIQEEVQPGLENRYDIGIEVPREDQVIAEAGEEYMTQGSKRWRVISRFEMRGVDLLQWKHINVELN